MQDNFEKSLELILHHEGGFVDHPEDPGGATNKGITLDTYSGYLGRKATVDELKNIPDDHVKDIYKNNYWDRVKGDDLPSGLDLCLFDWAVNSGFKRPARVLQNLLGVEEDGYIGAKTLEKCKSFLNNPMYPKTSLRYVISEVTKEREHFYRKLKHFDTFGKGWLRRNEETKNKSMTMCEGITKDEFDNWVKG